MYKKEDLLKQLAAIGVDPTGTLKVHLSYREIGAVDGRADTVIDALLEYMQAGLLVLASHTWWHTTEKNPVMDVLHTKSCVGIVPELFRKYPNVHRSLHPTHAVAAVGKDALEFVTGDERVNTPAGIGGAYWKLWERDAQILLIGVNFNRNTFIHGIEEWDGAVGTLAKEPTDLYVINHAGQRLHTPLYLHAARNGSETFSKLEPQAIQAGILTFGKFGDATTRLMSARKLRAMVAPILAEDPEYLLRY